jgi:hypothetical protein
MTPDRAATTISDLEIDRVVHGHAPVAEWIDTTAMLHGVSCAPEPIDDFADAVSRLSDAAVHLDEPERQLLALFRAGLISDDHRFALHAAYLRQRA